MLFRSSGQRGDFNGVGGKGRRIDKGIPLPLRDGKYFLFLPVFGFHGCLTGRHFVHIIAKAHGKRAADGTGDAKGDGEDQEQFQKKLHGDAHF